MVVSCEEYGSRDVEQRDALTVDRTDSSEPHQNCRFSIRKGLIVLACQLRMTTQYGNVRPVHPEALSRVDTTVVHLGSLLRGTERCQPLMLHFGKRPLINESPKSCP